MPRTLLTRVLPTAVTVGFVAVLWLAIAPPQLGGRTTLAVSYGTSMEPMIERGDVLLLREGGPPRVGDVVGYHSPTLGRLVVHRVLAVEDGLLRFKGDNNDFVDPDRLSQAAVAGHLVFQVPRLGFLLEELRRPQSSAGLAALAAFFVVGGGAARKRRRREDGDAPEGDGPGADVTWYPAALGVIGGLALVSALVAAVGFGRSGVAEARVPAYTETGTFAYAAATGPSVEAGGVARTGDPVFLAASGPLELTFSYSRSAGPERGTVALQARIESTAGWKRTLPLAASEPVAGREATVRAMLDLQRLRALLDRVEAETGVVGAPYKVEIAARVATPGGRDWSPATEFTLDARTLAPVEGPATRTRPVTTTATLPADVGLGPVSPSVRSLRVAGLAGLALAAVLLLLAVVVERRRRVPGEAGAIARRLRHGLLTVETIDVSDVTTVVELPSIDELVALAREYERIVLHQQRGADHAYTVVEDGVVYRYVLRGRTDLRAVEAAA